MDPLDEELPVRERYEAPPPAVGSKEWLGNEVDQAFGFPHKPREDTRYIEATTSERPGEFTSADPKWWLEGADQEALDTERFSIDVTGGGS